MPANKMCLARAPRKAKVSPMRQDASAPPTVSVEPDADPADVRTVHSGLLAFNVERLGEPDCQPLSIFLRDAAGTVVGGITGEIRWRWAHFAKVWVDERFRGQGAGSRLMAAAESYAHEQGCIGVHLSTFEYQARPFYEKLGYRLFGTLEGYPPGYCQFYLAKRLSDPA